MSDEELLDRATQLDRVLFTHDDDLHSIARTWRINGREFAGLFFAEEVAVSIGQAVTDLEIAPRVLEPHEMRNRVEFLPL